MAVAQIKAKASPLLLLLALGNFVVGMGVFVVIGIVAPIAEALRVSTAAAGMVITTYALAYALLSPIGAALTARLSSRTVLAGSLGLFCIGSLLSAVATSLPMLSGARLIVALGAALYTPLSAGVAVAMSPPAQRGRALAKVFAGMTMAQVIGVPLGSWLAYRYGWHAPFFVVAVLAAACSAVLILSMPRGVRAHSGSVVSILEALGDLRLMVALSFTATLMAAVYIVFTFFAPIVQASTGANPEARSLFLVLFGLGAVAGNFMGGFLSDHVGPLRTLVLVCVVHIIMLPLFAVMPWNPWLLALIVFTWSSFAWCFMAPQQSRLVAIAPAAPALALALNAAMVYAGIAIGSVVGARLLEWQGLTALGIAGGLTAGLALANLLMSAWIARKPVTPAAT